MNGQTVNAPYIMRGRYPSRGGNWNPMSDLLKDCVISNQTHDTINHGVGATRVHLPSSSSKSIDAAVAEQMTRALGPVGYNMGYDLFQSSQTGLLRVASNGEREKNLVQSAFGNFSAMPTNTAFLNRRGAFSALLSNFMEQSERLRALKVPGAENIYRSRARAGDLLGGAVEQFITQWDTTYDRYDALIARSTNIFDVLPHAANYASWTSPRQSYYNRYSNAQYPVQTASGDLRGIVRISNAPMGTGAPSVPSGFPTFAAADASKEKDGWIGGWPGEVCAAGDPLLHKKAIDLLAF
jgi:hypothetical protein